VRYYPARRASAPHGTSMGDGDVAFQPWLQTVKCPDCGTKLERNKEPGPAHAWRVAR
jgi:hypothetical protein